MEINLENWSGQEVQVLRVDFPLCKNPVLVVNEATGQFMLGGSSYALVKDVEEIDPDGWKITSYRIVACDDARKLGDVSCVMSPRETIPSWDASSFGLDRSGETPFIAAARLVANIC